MERSITVKGTGQVSVRPDLIEIPMTIEAVDPDYELAAAANARRIEAIRASLLPLGFERESIKTVNYQVSAQYESVRDEHDNWVQRFKGYACVHELRIEFGLDTDRLSAVLGALAACEAFPELSVCFTVRDPDAVRTQLLENAAENAREKAEVLCRASGVTMGRLMRIDYSWTDINVYANSRVMADGTAMMKKAMIEIEPEDIRVRDDAVFVWEIE